MTSDSGTPTPGLRLRGSDSGTPTPCFPSNPFLVFFDVVFVLFVKGLPGKPGDPSARGRKVCWLIQLHVYC
jgi:hypothetical protein